MSWSWVGCPERTGITSSGRTSSGYLVGFALLHIALVIELLAGRFFELSPEPVHGLLRRHPPAVLSNAVLPRAEPQAY